MPAILFFDLHSILDEQLAFFETATDTLTDLVNVEHESIILQVLSAAYSRSF